MVIATKPMSRLKARVRTASATRPITVRIWYGLDWVSGSVLGTSMTDEASPMVSSRSSRRDSASASP